MVHLTNAKKVYPHHLLVTRFYEDGAVETFFVYSDMSARDYIYPHRGVDLLPPMITPESFAITVTELSRAQSLLLDEKPTVYTRSMREQARANRRYHLNRLYFEWETENATDRALGAGGYLPSGVTKEAP